MKTIKAKEFDEKFDNGEDISGYFDFSKATRPNAIKTDTKKVCQLIAPSDQTWHFCMENSDLEKIYISKKEENRLLPKVRLDENHLLL